MLKNPAKKRKTYLFHSEWEHDYFFTEINRKCICLLCHATVAVSKKGNVERHFTRIHSKVVDASLPPNSDIRKEKVAHLKNLLISQQSELTTKITPADKTDALASCETSQNIVKTEKTSEAVRTKISHTDQATILASHKVSKIIAKKKKPFEDGEYIKECFLEAADCLFDNFENKSEIMSAINSLQLSALTVSRHVETMSEYVISQLKSDLENCAFFSMQLYEPTDISDTSQLALFVRMVFRDFIVKEGLLKILPLRGHTRSEDVFLSVQDYLMSNDIPVQKLVGITTDGAPAFMGRLNGFVALAYQDDMFPNFISYHCSIHQQALLCGRFLNVNNVMNVVVKLVNQVRAHASQRRQFRVLIEEVNLEYGELLPHTEVHWLSKARVLRCFYEIIPSMISFIKERGEDFSILEDPLWLRDLGFLIDITEKLNKLNVQLQCKDKNILQMISEIKSFSVKLQLWEENMRQGDLKHFPCLKGQVEKEENCMSYTGDERHIEMLSILRDDFQCHFSDLNKIESLAQFILNPYMPLEAENLFLAIEKYFHEDRVAAELEIATVQNDLCLKSVAGQENEESFWSVVPNEKYPTLINVALKLKALFCSTYLCESSFSSMKFVKNKFRSRMTHNHLDSCIQLGITSYEPDVELTYEMECQPSH